MSKRKKIRVVRHGIEVFVNIPDPKDRDPSRDQTRGPSAAGFVGDNESIGFALLEAEIEAAMSRHRGQGRPPAATVDDLRRHIRETGSNPSTPGFNDRAMKALDIKITKLLELKRQL